MIRLFLLSIWELFDPIYFSLTRLKHICTENNGKGVFRVRLTKYKGRDVVLADGKTICKNDLLLKIHLHNIRLLQEFTNNKNELSKGRGVYRRVMESMPLLASFILNHPEAARIKGIIGITLINRGYRLLGFECVMPENKLYSVYKKITHIPIYFLSNTRFSINDLKKHQSIYLMMSKETLIEKYKRLA